MKDQVSISVTRKIGFALLTLVLLGIAGELVLALFGLQPAAQTGDPLVGFSKHFPHFVNEIAENGEPSMITAPGRASVLNPQRFPAEKPENTVRIVCLGGSTTYGRPFWDVTSFSGWLRRILPVVAPGTKWEVINAGAISYASYRVLNVMEELASYEPDLFVIYTGQNEFLERRTYGNLLDQSPLLGRIIATSQKSRTVTAIQRIVAAVSGDSDQGGQRKKPIVLGGEVKRIPINAVGPEAYTRNRAFEEQVIAHFRLSLNRMIDIAGTAGASVVLVSPASNYRGIKPFKSEHSERLDSAALTQWEQSYRAALSAAENGDFQLALARFDECLSLDPLHAEAHYRHGQVLYESGDRVAARTAFRRAIEEDICPLRAPSSLLSVIAKVSEVRDAPRIDFQAVLERRSEDGITGANFFHDHVHPTLEANRILALEIVETMRQRNVLQTSVEWNPDATLDEVELLTDAADQDRRALELCKLAYVLDEFDQDEGASKAVQDALTMAPRNAEVIRFATDFFAAKGDSQTMIAFLETWTRDEPSDTAGWIVLGEALTNTGRLIEATAAYQTALDLEPDNQTANGQLGIVFSRLGDQEAALRHVSRAAELDPESAHTQNNLGLILAKLGRFDLAVRHYENAIALEPSLTSAYYNFGLALEQRGTPDQAASMYRRLLELAPTHEGGRTRLQALTNPAAPR